MTATLHAEWTKLRTVSGPAWLLLAVVVATVGLGAIAVVGLSCHPGRCVVDAPRLSLTGVQLGQVVVAVLAVLVVGGEYGTGMVRTTLTAMPRRTEVLAAKAAAVTGLVLVAGTVAVLGSFLTARLVLPGRGLTVANGFAPLSLSDGPTLRAAAGSVLYLALIALLSLGVAAVARDSATAIGVVLSLLFLFPILTEVVTDPAWKRHLEQLSPSGAGLAIQHTIGLDALAISPWHGLGVLAAWAAAALVAGALVLRSRDA